MRVWTIQPVDVMEEINRKGFYVCNPDKAMYISDPEVSFKDSYDWLVKEMYKRVGSAPSGVSYPVWAWYSRDWKHKKPDLRNAGYDTPGTRCVCIELEIPDNEVLLSDYDLWHYVLNKWWIDDSTCEEEWDRNQDWFDSLSVDYREKLKVDSWSKIFDLTPVNTKWMCKGRYIQATFWVLCKENIVDVRYFVCK